MDAYEVTNPKQSKTNPYVPGSGSGFARIRLKAGIGFGSGKIPKFRDLPITSSSFLHLLPILRNISSIDFTPNAKWGKSDLTTR
jgi:hypothetical protein